MKKNFKAINDEDYIEEFNNVKEENQLVLNPHEPEEGIYKRSTWHDEPEEVYSSSDEPVMKEISLYDNCKSLEENFESSFKSKYILVEVKKNGSMSIGSFIPDQFSKFVVDIKKIEKFGLTEFLVVDYDSIFGTRLTSFINYNSDFFTCDERVVFEALLIKNKYFKKPFYWSKVEIWKELGIKKDRANKIIKKFCSELEIISTEVKKSILDGRPQQITYFTLKSKKICELLPQIYNERESNVSQIAQIKKYLNFK
jgi:hypothetical protein